MMVCSILLLLSSVLAAFISRMIAVPIARLSQSTDKLASGDYAVRVPVKSLDEIGDLCRHFNELAQKLESNQTMRNQWVADISHEMRTPVSVLKAQIEAFLDGIRAPTPEHLAVLAAKIEDLRKLVDDLFELSLADAGSLSYQKQAVNITQILEDAISIHSPKLELAKIQWQCDTTGGEKQMVYGDEKRLMQLFNNVIENTCRYTDGGGLLRIEIAEQDDGVLITFDDTAPGVPEDKLEKIFDRLFRMEASRNRNTGGAGLGLALCKNIVVAHGGTIWAEQSLLGGLRIAIKLPKWVTND